MENNKTIWGFHARPEHEQFFLKSGYIGIGWKETRSLEGLNEREDVLKRYRETFTEDSEGRVRTCGGQLYRFANEMQKGDLVVYTRGNREVWIGEITGDYMFADGENADNPHLRKAKWHKDVPREQFSQGALFEFGSALTIFQIREFADEVYAALEGKSVELFEDADVVTGNIDYEQQAKDFVKKKLLRHEKGHGLAKLFAHLLEILGYHTDVSEPGADGGVDIVAYPDELGVRTPCIRVQCKSSKVGEPEIRDLHGLLHDTEQGIVVTLGTFTPDARKFVQNRGKLRLYDGDKLVDLILEHYEELGSSYKALIPLKKVYVPEAPNE